jgi:DNA-binding beta-propeller fold protein YncE
MPAVSPIFGRTVEAERTPPPISGGTLAITADGTRAVAADPDRDAVWIVSLAEGTSQRISFSPGDEPGRVALDGAGRAHVALRNGGGLAVIDIANARLIERRPTCAAPRGVAWQSSGNIIHVACVSGQLVSLDAATGARVRTLQLDDDLRDIVLTPTGMLVSRFRSAEVLALDDAGNVVSRGAAPTMDEPIRAVVRPDGTRFTPTENRSVPRVAWRLAGSAGNVVMLHQRAVTGPLLPSAAAEYYDNASNCRASVAQSAVRAHGARQRRAEE